MKRKARLHMTNLMCGVPVINIETLSNEQWHIYDTFTIEVLIDRPWAWDELFDELSTVNHQLSENINQ